MNRVLTILVFVVTAIACAENSFGQVDARDYGVVGDMITDDTVALNRLFSQVADYQEIIFSPGMRMKISATVRMFGKYGLRLRGMGAQGNGANPGTVAPQFIWYGRQGGTMVSIDKSEGIIVENLGFYPKSVCNQAPLNQADIAIDMDQSSENPGGITTDNILRRLFIAACGSPANDNFIGVRLSNRSMSNVENIRIEDTDIYCSGTGQHGIGVEYGPSFNLKNELLTRTNLSGCKYGVHIRNGMVTISSSSFQSNTVAVKVDGMTDRLMIENNDMENNGQVLVADGAVGIQLISNRFAANNPPASAGIIEVRHLPLTLIGNRFDPDKSGAQRALKCTDECSVVSMGNVYQNNTYASVGWNTFQSNAVSIQDKFKDPVSGFTSATGIMMGGAANEAYGVPKPVVGAGTFYYDSKSKRWRMSEDGQRYFEVGHTFMTAKDPGCLNIGDQWYDTSTNTTVYKVCLSVSGKRYWVQK